MATARTPRRRRARVLVAEIEAVADRFWAQVADLAVNAGPGPRATVVELYNAGLARHAGIRGAYILSLAARVERGEAAGWRDGVVGGPAGELGSRVRRAKTEKVPYILGVGDTDVENGTVGVNRRGSDEPERDVTVDDFVARLAAEVLEHK